MPDTAPERPTPSLELESRRLLSRRSLLDWMLATSAGALLVSMAYPVLRFLSPPRTPEATTHHVDAGTVNDPELLERGFKIVCLCPSVRL